MIAGTDMTDSRAQNFIWKITKDYINKRRRRLSYSSWFYQRYHTTTVKHEHNHEPDALVKKIQNYCLTA